MYPEQSEHTGPTSEKSNIPIQMLTCPVCMAESAFGSANCQSCGFDLARLGKTTKFRTSGLLNGDRKRPVGGISAPPRIKLAVVIDGKESILPDADSLIIGRINPGDPTPDVDLSKFDAANFGVSRLHARISRSHKLFHLCDLSSANGTFLNGLKLNPHQEHLLHDGDELRLARLTLKLRFKK